MINTELLKEARKKKKLSIRDMSRILGAKSSATYYNIENNKAEAKANQLVIISETLNLPLKKILL